MYRPYYGMSEEPFRRDLPPDGICRLPQFEEAGSRLLYTIRNRGFAVVTGPCGTGKTTLLRSVCDKLTLDRFKVVYISNSDLSPSGFYRTALHILGIAPGRSSADTKRQLAAALKNMPGNTGMQPAFVLDESHLFSLQMLEEVRFILNTDFDSQSAAGLILCGQDDLIDKLRLVKLTAIRQRIDMLCTLKPLTREQTQAYIAHHLERTGVSQPVFTDAAVSIVHEFAGGVPRIIDKVCTNLLIYGSQQHKKILDEKDAGLITENEFIV